MSKTPISHLAKSSPSTHHIVDTPACAWRPEAEPPHYLYPQAWEIVKRALGITNRMTGIVYAIKISNLEYSGLRIMDVKIGKSTDIGNTLSQYRRGNRDIELLDMWRPNPEKNLSASERGVHAIAENYAYDSQSEKFVFLQGRYQDFAETVNMVLRKTTREELKEGIDRGSTKPNDYTGTTPAAIEIFGTTHDVSSWTETLQTAVAEVLSRVDDRERIKEVSGRKREYFVDEERKSDLISPRQIPETNIYVETNFSATDTHRLIRRVLEKYGFDESEVTIFTEEGS
jgi:hypothetical protein